MHASRDDDLGAALRLAVGRLARLLRRHAVGGLTAGEYSALATLDRHGPMRPSELAAREGVSAPTLSRTVARLERHGLSARASDDADARASVMSVSKAGHDLLERVRRERSALLARGLRELSDEDRTAIAAALAPLEDLVEALMRIEAGSPAEPVRSR